MYERLRTSKRKKGLTTFSEAGDSPLLLLFLMSRGWLPTQQQQQYSPSSQRLTRQSRVVRVWLERILILILGCLVNTVLHPLWHPASHHHEHHGEQPVIAAPAVIASTIPIPIAKPPHVDLAIAVLVKGSDAAELDRVRQVYSRYSSGSIGSAGSDDAWSYRLVFVVADPAAPEGGALDGELFRVNVPSGYDKLSAKTLATMALRRLLSFSFLAKTDSDSFPCMHRLRQALADAGALNDTRLYAGMLNQCGKLFPKGHKLHDEPFMQATGELQCVDIQSCYAVESY